MTDEPSNATTPPPPPPGPRAGGSIGELRRSRDDRMIAGVCGGLGRTMGIDPVIFRITLAVLAVFGGIGLLIYGAAWLLIPEDGTAESEGARLLRGRSTLTTLAAVAIGVAGIAIVADLAGDGVSGGLPILLVVAVIAAIAVGSRRNNGTVAGGSVAGVNPRPAAAPWTRDRLLLVPLAVIAAVVGFFVLVAVLRSAAHVGLFGGVVGYGQERHLASLLLFGVVLLVVVSLIALALKHLPAVVDSRRPTPTAAMPMADPLGPPAGFSPSRPLFEGPRFETPAYGRWTASPGQVAPTYQQPSTPRVPREPSFLVPLTICLCVVVAGVLLGLGASGQVDVTAQDIFGAMLLATGIGLGVGSWLGRARLLIPVGVLLACGLIVASVVNVPLSGGIGSRQIDPRTVAELGASYQLGIGEEDLDLGQLDIAGRTAHVAVTLGVGRLHVQVPPYVKVVVRAYAGAGRTELFGVDGGTHITHTTTAPALAASPAVPPQAGELDLDLRIGTGEIDVDRAYPYFTQTPAPNATLDPDVSPVPELPELPAPPAAPTEGDQG